MMSSKETQEIILAGRVERIFSYLVDLIFATAVQFIVLVLLSFTSDEGTFFIIKQLLAFCSVVSIQGYLLIKTGQTVGKKVLGIKIYDSKTLKIPNIVQVFFIRYLLIWQLPSLLLLFGDQNQVLFTGQWSEFPIYLKILVFISFFVYAQSLLIFRSNRRTGHDLLAGTVVGKINNPLNV